jgi:maltose O-acetyltransferase
VKAAAEARWPGPIVLDCGSAADLSGLQKRLQYALGIALAAVVLRGCERGSHVSAHGRVRVEGRRGIRLGSRVVFLRGTVPTELVAGPGAELLIGSNSVFNYGTSLRATRSIRIGSRCLFGSMVRIRDADEEGEGVVVVGDDVWLSHGVIVEPGAVIGDGSVVAAGSVVRDTVPPRSLASGNPAVCVPLDRVTEGRPPPPRWVA